MSEARRADMGRGHEPARRIEPDRELSQLWRQGQRPDVRTFLARAGTLSLAQVVAVLAVDQRERWQSGERIPAEVYLEPYPALQADIEKALELVYGEFLLREERGESPTLEEFVQRFPPYAERLRQQWSLHRALASSLRQIQPREEDARGHDTVLSPAPSAESSDALLDSSEADSAGSPSASGHDGAVESTRTNWTQKIRPLPLCPPAERYTLTRLHAQGGLGQVWLARDVTLGREVALKELRPERADYQPLRDRFLEEATITGQLEHPGIVPVYELAQRPETNQPFYTMRFIKGRTLSEASQAYHQKRQTGHVEGLDLVALLNAFVAVCHAVAYAHARGVIHRDLKGRNVVLGDFGEVMVLDWGLAKVRSEPTPKPGENKGETTPETLPRVRLDDYGWREETAEGQVLGTPGYMAPEQALGRQAEIDERTDIYGLGALLYEILTGQPPFTGDNLEEVQQKVIQEPPLPPRALVPTTGRALQAICLRALAKKSADRYAAAAELANELQRYLADEPVSAYREPLPARLRRWTRRHRTLVTGLAALLVTAVILLAVGIFLIGRKEQEAVAARKRAEDNYQLARDAVEQYFVKITDNPRLKEAGLRDLRKELLEEAGKFYTRFIQERGQEPGLEYELGRAHVYLAMVREEMGALTEAIDQVLKGREILHQLVDLHPHEPACRERLAFAENRLGLLYQKQGKLAEAHEAYSQAGSLYQQLAGEYSQEQLYQFGLATVLHNQGWLAQEHGQPAEAVSQYRTAIALQIPLRDSFPQRANLLQSLARNYSNLGTLYNTQFTGRDAEAERCLQESLQLRQQIVDLDPRNANFQADLAQSYNNLAIVYKSLQRFVDAERAYQEAGRRSEQLANQHRDAPRYQALWIGCLANLGALYGEMNQWNRAEEYQQQALRLQKELADAWPQFPEYRYMLASLFANRGFHCQKRGLWDKAEQDFLSAAHIVEQLIQAHAGVADYPLTLGEFYGDLGELLLMTGKTQAALEWYSKAIAQLGPIRKQVPKDPRVSSQLSRMHEGTARSLSRLSKHAEALQAWDRAIQTANGRLQDDFRVGRAVTLARMHEPARATGDLEDLLKQECSPTALYNAACVFALSAATPALEPEQANQYAARAVNLLRKAAEKGFQNVEAMKSDNDLLAIHRRADFKQLLVDIDKKTLSTSKTQK